MKNYKVYGNESTHLTLSDRAFDIYSNTDPLEILEHETDGEYLYSINGAEFYTAQEVEEYLISLDED